MHIIMHIFHLHPVCCTQCFPLTQALVYNLITIRIHQCVVCTPFNTHRYTVGPNLVRGSLQCIGDPDQCPHFQNLVLDLEVPGLPTAAAHQPRPYSHNCSVGVTHLQGREGTHRKRGTEMDTLGSGNKFQGSWSPILW